MNPWRDYGQTERPAPAILSGAPGESGTGENLTRSQAARLWASWRDCTAFLKSTANPAHARNLRSCNVRPWSMLPHWWNTSIRLGRARNFYSTAGGWTILPSATSRARESLISKVFLKLRKTRPPPRARESLSLSCCRGTLGRYGVGGTPSVAGGSQRE